MANLNLKFPQGELYSENRHEMTPARRKMIQEDRKKRDLYGPELPFDFGIFKSKLGNKPKNVFIECSSCGCKMWVTKNTYMIICKCGNLCTIK